MPKTLVDTAARFLRDMTETQLAKMIRAKKLQLKRESLASELDHLNAEARRKADEIHELDRKIRVMLKNSGVGRRKRVGDTLGDAVLKVLAKASRPMGLTEITKTLLSGGHRTHSAFQNFRTTVAHTLRKLREHLARKGEGYVVKGKTPESAKD